MRLRRLQHVSTPIPGGSRKAVRDFYGGVLGLSELPPPDSLAHLTLAWFSAGDGLELHFVEADSDARTMRHFCLDVEDLDETRRQLEAAGLKPYDTDPIPGRPRFFCRDPVGNLIEFTSIESDYRSAG